MWSAAVTRRRVGSIVGSTDLDVRSGGLRAKRVEAFPQADIAALQAMRSFARCDGDRRRRSWAHIIECSCFASSKGSLATRIGERSMRRQWQLHAAICHVRPADALGLSVIETVDDDLGRTAAASVARAGFKRMVADVSARSEQLRPGRSRALP
jgi:hypothetical protein